VNGSKRGRSAGPVASSQPRADQRSGVTHGAIDAILGMISAGELSPGDKLPREKELAAQLGLSRNSLREAVRALTLLRVLEPRQGDGTYVTSLQPQLLTEAMGLVADLMNERAVAELYQVRRILEAEASMLAAVRMTPAELEHLRDVLNRITADSPVDEFIDGDADFHDLVARASGNQVLASLLRSLSSRTMRARRWRALLEEGALERTVDQHRRIFRAIELRDPEVARAAAALHVAEGETWLRDRLPEIESGLEEAKAPRP
jgi:DNA-binding FadR family transcriptional regulator